MKYCQSCGNELSEGAKFCTKCGAAVEPNQEPEVTATQAVPESVVSDTKQAAANAQAAAETPKRDQTTQANPDQPQLGFVGSIQYIMQHAFEMSGGDPESRKSVFWWGYLGICIVSFVVAFIPGIGWLLSYMTTFLLISACMRRLTYIGQNAGLGWLLIVPLVGIYPFFLMLLDKKVA